jgi:hypothetical protein
MHFFDLMNSSYGPAATRWAVLLWGKPQRSASIATPETRTQ